MDSGQRQKFTQQLLRLVTDPERRRVAMELFGAMPAPKETPQAKPISIFWGSTPVWGALGVLGGVIGSQISLKLLIIAVWGTLWLEFVRARFFSTPINRRITNTAFGAVLGIVFWLSYPYVKPRDQPTIDQQMDSITTKLSQRFPWLAKQPQAVIVEAPSPPTQHTQVEYLGEPDAEAMIHAPSYPVITEGETPIVVCAFKNAGDFTVEGPGDVCIVEYVPFRRGHDAEDLHAAFVKAHKNFHFNLPSGNLVRNSRGEYHTAYGQTITANDEKQYKASGLAICGFGAVRWSDGTGRYETDFAQCLMQEVGFTTSNWHNIRDNNTEIKLR